MKKIYYCLLLSFISGAVLLAEVSEQPKGGWDSVYLKNGLIEVQVVPKIGGRVIQYKLGDYAFFWVNEDLVDKEPPASRLDPNGKWLNYGGEKIWPAPQGRGEGEWPGPPDTVIDGGPYTAEPIKENDKLTAVKITSEQDKKSGIQMSRVIRAFENTTHISIDATMKNIDTKPRRWGIWPVAQFDTANRHGEGFNKNYWTYCPINPNSMYHSGYNMMHGLAGHLSYKPDYEKAMMRIQYDYRVAKIGMDSSAGWAATLDATDGYVFVHRFTYEPGKEYPDGASVEFWLYGLGEIVEWKNKVAAMPDNLKENPYCLETELLSPLTALSPGQSYTFHYDWYAARVPAGCEVTACSDIGVTCKLMSAGLREGKLALDGSFGIFYKGTCRAVFLDKDDKEIQKVPDEMPVTPLQPLILSQVLKSDEGVLVPENAEKLAICLYDTNAKFLGEVARSQIVRN